jgi:hypothetical protein
MSILLEVLIKKKDGTWITIAYISSEYSAHKAISVWSKFNDSSLYEKDDIGIIVHKVIDPNK